MRKKLKFVHNKDVKVYFTSDLHVFHNPSWPIPIWKMRGRKSADDAAQHALEEINRVVRPQDILINCGDGFLNSTPDQVKNFLEKINCKNHFYLWGNHESSIDKIYREGLTKAGYPESIEVYPFTYAGLTFIGEETQIIVNKQLITVSHFANRIWDKSHHGAWSISGHSHGTDKERNKEFPNGKALDVGWEKGSVYSFDEVKEIMDNKNLFTLDHHDENTN